MNIIAAKVDLAITDDELREITQSDSGCDYSEHLIEEILESVRVAISSGRYTIQEPV